MINREDVTLIKNILSLHNNNVNVDFLYNVLTATKDFKDLEADILDSFSANQFRSKLRIIESIEKLNILNKDSEVIIFGSWYGSILIPRLADKVKRITCIDLDEQVLKISKNRMFKQYDNVDYIVADVFEKYRGRYTDAKLFINASCEHMKPMKEFPWFPADSYFAFTSNDMESIEGHVNCVHSISEFEAQLPKSEILFKDEIADTRGIRYLLVGKFL